MQTTTTLLFSRGLWSYATSTLCSPSRWMWRGMASEASASSPPEPPKPKSKAATALRRTASQSNAIRHNPTPTRSVIKSVYTLTTAEKYFLPRLRPHLPKSARKLHDAWWIPQWQVDDREGEVFIFGNGSFVCWGLEERDAYQFANNVVAKPNVEFERLKEPETEDIDFVTDPKENTRLQGDLIILGEMPVLSSPEDLIPNPLPLMSLPTETLMARYAFSQALARSTALSAYEVLLENFLSSVATLPAALQKTGKPGLGRRDVIMKLGELLKFRQGLNLTNENFSETPDFYWGEPALEGYFHSMTDALEVRQRTTALNDKITYASEVQSVLRQLLTESSGHRMELIIIALIAVEVVICLIRDGPELWQMAFGGSLSEPVDSEPSSSSTRKH